MQSCVDNLSLPSPPLTPPPHAILTPYVNDTESEIIVNEHLTTKYKIIFVFILFVVFVFFVWIIYKAIA
jgi:hypothetical protein